MKYFLNRHFGFWNLGFVELSWQLFTPLDLFSPFLNKELFLSGALKKMLRGFLSEKIFLI
jgi:hypothetical protein